MPTLDLNIDKQGINFDHDFRELVIDRIESAIMNAHTKDGTRVFVDPGDRREIVKLGETLRAHKDGIVELGEAQYDKLVKWWNAPQPVAVGTEAVIWSRIDKNLCPGAWS